MKRLLYLATLGLVASMMFAPTALAQDQYRSPFCQQIQDQIAAGVGDNPPTTAELLSCGISPEVISPCEGVPDPSCAANNPPGVSFGGPNGATANDTQNCVALPEGSPESIACYEELVADLTGSSPAPTQTTQYDPGVSEPSDPAQTGAGPGGEGPCTGPFEAYIAEVNGCVTTEGQPDPGAATVFDADTREPIGTLAEVTELLDAQQSTPTATTPTTATEAIDEETPGTTTTTPLPDTGGISLLIPASLLLASGLIGLGMMRRK